MAILSIGPIGNIAENAIITWEKNSGGKSVALYDMRFVKPLDTMLLHEIGEKFNKIITIENGVIMGGFGSAVIEFMSENGYHPKIKRLGLPDSFVEHGSTPLLLKLCKLDQEAIIESVNNMIGK